MAYLKVAEEKVVSFICRCLFVRFHNLAFFCQSHVGFLLRLLLKLRFTAVYMSIYICSVGVIPFKVLLTRINVDVDLLSPGLCSSNGLFYSPLAYLVVTSSFMRSFLCLCLSVCPVCLFLVVRLCIWLYWSVCPVSICLFFERPVCPCVYPSVPFFVCLFVCLSFCLFFVFPSCCLSNFNLVCVLFCIPYSSFLSSVGRFIY